MATYCREEICNNNNSANLKLKMMIKLFPALAQESSKLQKVHVEDSDAGAPCINEEHSLPWHHHHRLPLLHAPPDAGLLPHYRGIVFETRPLTDSFPLKGSRRSLRSGGGGWNKGRAAAGHYCCSSSSTTLKKTLGSLSASVYDELQPFRLAHRNLIKSRMAAKTIQLGRAMTSNKQKTTPLESGLEKLSLCASSYAWTCDRRSINVFQRTQIHPIEFREQLKMGLQVVLRPSEAYAVASHFDTKGNGMVDRKRFYRWFLLAGNSLRQERQRKQTAELQEEQEHQRQKQKDEEDRRRAANEAVVSVEFSPQDKAAAEDILAKVALSYHNQRTSGRKTAQRDFACALCPIDLRDQLYKSFKIRLTDRQFAALFRQMDRNGDGHVDGIEFLIYFFGLAGGEKTKLHRKQRANGLARKRNLRPNNNLSSSSISPILGR